MNINVTIKILLLIISGLSGIVLGEQMIYPPSHQYFIHPNGQATFVAYNNWKIFSPRKFQVNALITEIDHEGALRWMIMGWLDQYDLRDFAVLSKHWKPKERFFSTDPNIVIVMDGDKTIEAIFEKDPNYVDPNEVTDSPRIDGLYFTLGDGFAVHTYLDCRHLIGKEDRIALIFDPHDVAERNICLTCVARRTREDE